MDGRACTSGLQPATPTTSASASRSRRQDLALPAPREYWQLLERFNKDALARRFPGWDARPARSPREH